MLELDKAYVHPCALSMLATPTHIFETLIAADMDLLAAANAVAQEALGNMRTVSAFNAQQRTAEKYSEVRILVAHWFLLSQWSP